MRARPLTLKRAKQLRQPLTRTEIALWSQLKGRRLAGLHFRLQHPIGPYILDFYCTAAKLAVEIDGYSHGVEGAEAHDGRRDAWLAAKGIETLRVLADTVRGDLTPVLETILAHALPRLPPQSASPTAPPHAGEPKEER